MAATYDAHGMEGSDVAVRSMVNQVTQQAMVMSFSDVFMILTVLFSLMLIGVAMISKPKPPPKGAPGGGH
jgi:DHA2 family multidrug resistance protein